jgi:uncharacterized membrane protein YkvA (DUF1232 family)
VEHEVRAVDQPTDRRVAEAARSVVVTWTRRVQRHLATLSRAMQDALRAGQARAVAFSARQVRLVRREVDVLALVARDARTPWYAKLVAALSLSYTFSLIQLSPNVIPVLGSLDDVVVLALGIRLALWLTPPETRAACRQRATEQPEDHATRLGWRVLLVAGALWLAMAALGALGVAAGVAAGVALLAHIL